MANQDHSGELPLTEHVVRARPDKALSGPLQLRNRFHEPISQVRKLRLGEMKEFTTKFRVEMRPE